MEKTDEKIIYEPHPVTPERKAELRAKGYKIIDARFAPEGYEYPEELKPQEGGQAFDPRKAKKDELIGWLADRGFAAPEGAKKDEIVALVEAEMAKE